MKAGSSNASAGSRTRLVVTWSVLFVLSFAPQAGAVAAVDVDNTARGDELKLGLVVGIDVEKTANPVGPVNAGDEVGWDVVVTNSAPITVTDVSVTDNLPAGVDWTLGAVTGATTGLTCDVFGAAGAEVLTCNDVSMATGESFMVHLAGPTDPADCGTITNTAIVTTSNDGGDTDLASVGVQCPDVTVSKTPDGGAIGVGDSADFTIVVTNLGPGAAYDVSLSDSLPSGIDWVLGGIGGLHGLPIGLSCQVTGALGSEVLTCSAESIASGDDFSVTVAGLADAADCGTLNNTATVSASNESPALAGNNSDAGSMNVLCDIAVEKTDSSVGPVNAGNDVAWDIRVTNFDPGAVTDVVLVDILPAGIDWTLGAVTGDTTGLSCALNGPVGSEILNCLDDSMAADDSFRVHLSGPTDAADCGTIENSTHVSTANDGADLDGASVVVVCPIPPTPAASLFSSNTSDSRELSSPDLILTLVLILGLFTFGAVAAWNRHPPVDRIRRTRQ
jgi:uncharacterized repeat protein (TIGR01451 family)